MEQEKWKRTLPEANVGEPVTATDSDDGDGGRLIYTISGHGSYDFSVDRNNGQIKTANGAGPRDAGELQRNADGYRPVRAPVAPSR